MQIRFSTGKLAKVLLGGRSPKSGVPAEERVGKKVHGKGKEEDQAHSKAHTVHKEPYGRPAMEGRAMRGHSDGRLEGQALHWHTRHASPHDNGYAGAGAGLCVTRAYHDQCCPRVGTTWSKDNTMCSQFTKLVLKCKLKILGSGRGRRRSSYQCRRCGRSYRCRRKYCRGRG